MRYCPRRWDTSRDTGPLAVHPVGFEQMSVGVGDGRVLYIIINVLGGKSSNKIISLLWFAYLYVPNEVDGAEDIRNWFFGRIISSERCLRFIIKNFGESIIFFLESYTFSTAKFRRYHYVASNLLGITKRPSRMSKMAIFLSLRKASELSIIKSIENKKIPHKNFFNLTKEINLCLWSNFSSRKQ